MQRGGQGCAEMCRGGARKETEGEQGRPLGGGVLRADLNDEYGYVGGNLGGRRINWEMGQIQNGSLGAGLSLHHRGAPRGGLKEDP